MALISCQLLICSLFPPALLFFTFNLIWSSEKQECLTHFCVTYGLVVIALLHILEFALMFPHSTCVPRMALTAHIQEKAVSRITNVAFGNLLPSSRFVLQLPSFPVSMCRSPKHLELYRLLKAALT